MNNSGKISPPQQGTSLIEVLVTMVILLIGLLGLAGLMAQGQRSEMESYQRTQALILLQDMEGRINANRKAAACYAITTNATSGTPYLGSGSTVVPACATGTAAQQALAIQDMTEWNNLLQGAAETSGGNPAGAMIGARGCVSSPATNVYLISVAWQGLGNTYAPPASLGCGKNLYGSEAQRRVVSLTLQIATLN